MIHDPKDLSRKLWLAFLMLALTVGALIFQHMTGCSVEPKKPAVAGNEAPEPSPDPSTPPDPTPGPTPDLPECSQVVTFDELAPVIGLNCAGCHQGYDTYPKASEKIDAMLTRIKIPAGQPNHMPAGRADLAPKDVAVFANWLKDGTLRAGECKGTSNPNQPEVFKDLKWLEQKIADDLDTVPIADQANVRYLVAVDLVNRGLTDELLVARDAAAKGANSVSVKRDLQQVLNIASGIWRVNIDDLGIEQGDWLFIEQHSQLQFESFTQRGLALKQIVKSRLPWMLVDDFLETTLRQADVYYRLTEAPATLQQLTRKLGVDYAEDLANFKALLVGFNGSALSPAANRLMSRHDSDDGFFWSTYDTGPIVSDKQNLFTNPLLAEAGGRANLKFAAGEQLYSLPNGLIASFLANAAGARLNEADPNVVHDFTANPSSPIIKNASSCYRCHSGGLLRATDQVRAAVPGAGLGADDTQRALALFKPQPEVDRNFGIDNTRFTAAMQAIAVDPTKPDPISKVLDAFLGDLTAEQIAGKLFLRVEDLRTCINLSAKGRQQAGQLLTGGSISHDQLVQVVKFLIADCRLFQDPLAR